LQAFALNGVSSKQANSTIAQGLQGLAEVLTNGTHPQFQYGTIAIGQGASASSFGERGPRCTAIRLKTLLSWPGPELRKNSHSTRQPILSRTTHRRRGGVRGGRLF
jgi:hypothetical protein